MENYLLNNSTKCNTQNENISVQIAIQIDKPRRYNVQIIVRLRACVDNFKILPNTEHYKPILVLMQ